MKNIYDLEGNYYEWTQEAYDTSYRTFRGGYSNGASNSGWFPASFWTSSGPSSIYGDYSSRSALYVTL